MAAAGGTDFVTSGPTLLLVGDNPGGRERVKVDPLSGRGKTRMLGNVLAMAGGSDAILDPSQTNPALEWLKQQQAKQAGGGGNKPGAAPVPIDWTKIEQDYLDKSFAMKKDHFARQRALDEEQYQAERKLKKQQDAEQKALEKQLQAQFDAQLKQLQSAKDRDDEAARQRHYARLAQIDSDAQAQMQRNRAGFNAAAAAIQEKAAATQNQVASFWYEVQGADLCDQLQEQNAAVQAAAEVRKEQTQVYLDQDLAANEEAQAAREQALREAQDAIREQYLDDLSERHRLEKQALDDYYNERQSILKDILSAEEKVFDSFWEKLYEGLPGGEEILKKLKERPDTRGQFKDPAPGGTTGPGPVYGGPVTGTGPGPIYNPNPGPVAPPRGASQGFAAPATASQPQINNYFDRQRHLTSAMPQKHAVGVTTYAVTLHSGQLREAQVRLGAIDIDAGGLVALRTALSVANSLAVTA